MERDADVPWIDDPRAPAQHFNIPFLWTGRILLRSSCIGAKPISAPFPDVSQHIAQSFMRAPIREQADGRGVTNGIAIVRARSIQPGLIAPGIPATFRASRRTLPF